MVSTHLWGCPPQRSICNQTTHDVSLWISNHQNMNIFAKKKYSIFLRPKEQFGLPKKCLPQFDCFPFFFLFWERLLLLSVSFITLLINLHVIFNDKSLIYECSWDISATSPAFKLATTYETCGLWILNSSLLMIHLSLLSLTSDFIFSIIFTKDFKIHFALWLVCEISPYVIDGGLWGEGHQNVSPVVIDKIVKPETFGAIIKCYKQYFKIKLSSNVINSTLR